MRFLLTFRVRTEKGNALAQEGTLGQTTRSVMEKLGPEATYFADIEGARGGYLVVNMYDASQVPAMAEPLSLGRTQPYMSLR